MNPALKLNLVAADLLDLDKLKQWIHSDEGDLAAYNFCVALADLVGSRQAEPDKKISRRNYARMCAQAEKYADTFTIENLRIGFEFLQPMQKLGRPGHDTGHRLRDELRAAAMMSDPIVQFCQYAVERFGMLVGGTAHDCSTGLANRWQDWKRRCGHGELAAVFIFLAFEHMPMPVRLVLAYQALAHTNFPSKKVDAIEGFVRPKWWADMWKGKRGFIGVGMVKIRGIDRVDNMGVFLLVRHILSAADTVLEGGGVNILGGNEAMTYNVDEFTLLQALILDTNQPVLITGEPAPAGQGYPTSLYHIIGYMTSALYENNFSKHDGDSEVLSTMLATAMRGFVSLVMQARLNNPAKTPITEIKARMKKVFYAVSLAQVEDFERAWKLISLTFDKLSHQDKLRWGNILDLVVKQLVGGCDEAYYFAINSNDEIAKVLAKDAYNKLGVYDLSLM